METNTTSDGAKKVILENLSREDLIKRCERLLVLAQKAKQAKDALQEENNELKAKLNSDPNKNKDATDEIIESLTQQKLNYVTSIEDLKKRNNILVNKLQKCTENLQIIEEKNNVLDSENFSFKRQIKRLTDENEQLIADLESMEKQMEECKKLGLEQQNQLLLLEKSKQLLEDANKKLKHENETNNTEELQKMLNISLQEVKKLQTDNAALSEKIGLLKVNLSEKDKNILTISEELQSYVKLVENLQAQSSEVENKKVQQLEHEINILRQQHDVLSEKKIILEKENMDLKMLQSNRSLETDINTFKEEIKTLKEISSDLNERNLILEKEKSELKAALKNVKLEFETSVKELLETVRLLKDKLRSYHGKIVKLAGNIKTVKENKNDILALLKSYTAQVEEWKGNLNVASRRIYQFVNKLTAENEDYLNEIKKLRESNAKFIEQLEAHKTDDEKSKALCEFEAIRNENKALSEEIRNLSEIVNEYKTQVATLTSEKNAINENFAEQIQRHQDELKVFDDQSKQDSIEIQNHIKENEKICIEYRKIVSKLEEDINLNMRELDQLRLKNFDLQEALDHAKETEQQIAERTSEEILKLVRENAELLETNRRLQEKRENIKEVECQTIDEASSKNELEEMITSLKRENSELLTEMNEMNQALKERGETISKFQSHCEEIMKKLQIYETQANRNVDNISQKEETIKNLEQEIEKLKMKEKVFQTEIPDNVLTEKNKEIAELKTEIECLRERINATLDNSYAESETMSTSTISRSEEVNRLKDFEGSWEERYGKLRILAVKLKGKVRDLSNELLKEQNEKNDIQQKCASNMKTISSLQAQLDSLQDELEAIKQQNKDYSDKLDFSAAEISKDKQRLVENDEVIAKLKKEIDELTQEKINTESWKKQISAKVQTFRKELEANKVLKKEYEAKIAKLTADLEAKEQALKAESDGHQQTKHSLEHSNNERMKNSVLNLEMQDYERSVKELSQKLENKQEEINKLKSQVDSQKSTGNAIREQNKILEERVEETKNELGVLQNEIVSYKKKISDLEDVVLQKEDKIQNVTQLLETIRSENEELSTELSKVIAEHQKHNNNLKSEKDKLRNQVLGLQQTLREVQDSLKLKEDELKIVHSDYENYKVRAQSVLRQNQNRDVGLEEKLLEELSTVKAKCETFNSELLECKDTIEVLKKSKEILEQEKNELTAKYEEVISELDDIKSMYDQLSNKHQQTIIEHGETVRSLKIHAETLAQCYRQQLSEQEVRHNREIIELQSKIDKAPSPTEMPFPPLPTMHREEGEGSESTETTSKNNVHPVPLERLLGSDTDQEIVYIKKQLGEEESKVIHLTALLADTEQDLAKHVQMNKLLKEEIRRQQRSVEREKHAENLEYLKNVVFKFVTLHSGDERSRLVPVLNTILKLSPEETQKLSMVAKGDPGMRGWTNYLPLWSPSKSS